MSRRDKPLALAEVTLCTSEVLKPFARNDSKYYQMKATSILIQIDTTWKAFREGLKAWYEHPEKFRGKPKIPGYKHKEQGRYLLIYDMQAIGKRAYKKTGMLVPSGLPIQIKTKVAWEAIDQVRIIPRRDF